MPHQLLLCAVPADRQALTARRGHAARGGVFYLYGELVKTHLFTPRRARAAHRLGRLPEHKTGFFMPHPGPGANPGRLVGLGLRRPGRRAAGGQTPCSGLGRAQGRLAAGPAARRRRLEAACARS